MNIRWPASWISVSCCSLCWIFWGRLYQRICGGNLRVHLWGCRSPVVSVRCLIDRVVYRSYLFCEFTVASVFLGFMFGVTWIQKALYWTFPSTVFPNVAEGVYNFIDCWLFEWIGRRLSTFFCNLCRQQTAKSQLFCCSLWSSLNFRIFLEVKQRGDRGC